MGQENQEKQEMVTRLAICVVAALILYYGGEKACTAFQLPYWEQYRPWLEKNRIQAVAVVAAVLFGVSLAVIPLKGKTAEANAPGQGPEMEGFTACESEVD